MDGPVDPLESLWEQLLSRQPDLVNQAFQTLLQDEKQVVLSHLQRMANEEGWHPEQRLSAREALRILHFEQNE